ncbi:MAG: hypothetical protein KJ050_15550, partial [Candidatus Omnitrophica bacterium]|nr:hypothetical protein [Candidatus Omnitrophota bacterium]
IHWMAGVDPRFREDDKREGRERRNAPASRPNGWKVPGVGATFMAPGTQWPPLTIFNGSCG